MKQQTDINEYKRRHDCLEKVIHWELCKRLELDPTDKWYIQKPETVLENETHKIFCAFEIWTGHTISARRVDLVIINKEKWIGHRVDFVVRADHKVKMKENEKIEIFLDLARKLKKMWNMKVTVMPLGALGTVLKGIVNRLGKPEIRKTIKTIQTTAWILRSITFIIFWPLYPPV